MIDITKDEFWESRYEEVSKIEKKTNIIKEFIFRHKIIMVLLSALAVLMITNTILIYNFFIILASIK